ncbi:hypothetical protein [Candidatus Mesenet endosymbiont of Agriotes lineatus]|uniref:hypothetical protein n=1 Tax=Candidatus Mesenet endosymbiont of Agriotes lineatus TaxID=3077948 RepID=UPI0030D627CC
MVPLILGTVLTGIGLFGNKLDSNVKFIASIAGFAALSFFVLYSAIDSVKNIKQEYESELKNASHENGVKDQELHA